MYCLTVGKVESDVLPLRDRVSANEIARRVGRDGTHWSSEACRRERAQSKRVHKETVQEVVEPTYHTQDCGESSN